MSNDGTELGKARQAVVPSAAFGSLLTRVAPTGENPDETPAAEPGPSAQAVPEGAAPTRDSKKEKQTTPRVKASAGSRPTAVAPITNDDAGGRSIADKGVQVSLPASLEARLQDYKASSGLSHPDILFTAIETVFDQLPELVQESVVQVPERRLFNRPAAVVRRAEDVEPRKPFIMKITQENRDVLDELWQSIGAPSRNAMLIAAYNAFLPTA